MVSMSNARKLRRPGYKDTWEAFEDTVDALEKEGILPPVNGLKEMRGHGLISGFCNGGTAEAFA